MRIEQYPLPEDPGDPTWRAVAQLMRADIRENFGPHGPEHDAAELLTQATTSVGRVRRWLAMEGEEVLGFARCVTDHPDNPDGADVHVHVGATHRGRGCGRALAEVVLESVRGVAHVTARLFTSIPEAGDALPCPGGGAVDRNSHNVRLARSLGLDLGNVYWLGHHDLAAPVEDLEQPAVPSLRGGPATRSRACHPRRGSNPSRRRRTAPSRTLPRAPSAIPGGAGILSVSPRTTNG
ncbi:GNAT family N-acetyltransferase [Arachnia propionica]|nr:GNAT family N-acetyltransferase [Arachnia propionica]